MKDKNVSIEYLQRYIKSKDYHPELTTDYFLKLTEEVGECRGRFEKTCALPTKRKSRKPSKKNFGT